MINPNARFTVLEHCITLNWDDGPTLHKLIAQVRYHRPGSVTARTLRVFATHYAGEPCVAFQRREEDLEVHWEWCALGGGGAPVSKSAMRAAKKCLWIRSTCSTSSTPQAGSSTSVRRPGYGSVLWRAAWLRVERLLGKCGRRAQEQAKGLHAVLSCWYPTVSNRTRPPALLIRALPSASPLPTELRLNLNGERFERLTARCKTDGLLLAPGETVRSAWFWLLSGDDPAELLRCALPTPEEA